MAETAGTDNQSGEITTLQNWRVVQNVLLGMTFLLFFAMLIVGCVYSDKCPIQPMLAIYVILQGISGLIMTILYIIKYRFSVGESMTRTFFLTAFIIICILSFLWLLAGTHLLRTSGCSGTNLHKAGIGFVTILWIGVFISAIILYCVKVLSCITLGPQIEPIGINQVAAPSTISFTV